MVKEEDIQAIGAFAKPHGVKGEIALTTDYDLAELQEIVSEDLCIICEINGILTPFFIVSYRQKNASTYLITFEHVDTVEKVNYLSGKTAFFPTKYTLPDIASSEDDGELIGYTLLDNRHKVIGQVKAVDDRTLNILLTVDYQGSELLVPLALSTSIQHHTKTINLSLPDGYLEIMHNND